MQSMQISRANVELFGRKYTLKGDVDPEYMMKLSQYVNTKIHDLKEIAAESDPLRIVLLMSLNLADELFQARQGRGTDAPELKRMEEKTMRLLQMLESGLVGEYYQSH